MALKQKFTTADTLTLPINDKTYVVEAVDADMGLLLTELSEAGAAAESGHKLSDAEIERLSDLTKQVNMRGESGLRRVLGPAYDEMRADGVPWNTIQLAAGTVVTWTVTDKRQAEVFWNSGGKPPKGRKPQDRQGGKASARSTK